MKARKQPPCKGSNKPGIQVRDKVKCSVCGFPFPTFSFAEYGNIPKHHKGRPT